MTNYTPDDLTERGLQEMAYERDLAAQTRRAEDAEAEIDGMLEQESFLEAQLANMQQDLAALRAQLAAGEWRPVTEPPEIGAIVKAECSAFIKNDGMWHMDYVIRWRPYTASPEDDAQ